MSGSGYSHQDWTTVVLKPKKPTVEKSIVRKDFVGHTTVSSVTGKPAWKIEEQVDSDQGKPVKYVSKEDAAAIVRGRVEKKMTQKDLAQKLNMSVKDIADIESSKAVENKQIIGKIKRAIGLS